MTAVLVLCLAVAVIAPSFGILMPDTKPEIYLNPGRSFRDYLWPWQDNPGMGMPSFNVGLAPVCAVVWLVELVGTEPWLAARLLRLVLLLLAGWGVAALVRRLPAVPRWRWAPLVAAVLLIANPYTITAGATLPILLPLATLPWMALFLLRGLEAQRCGRWAASFGLAFAAGSGMNAGVVPVLQLLAVPAVVLIARSAGLATWRRCAVVVAWCAAWTVLLSLYWLVPTAAAQGSGGVVLENTETLSGIFGPSSLAESIRGLGLWPLYGGDAGGPWQPGFAPYLTSGLVVTCSFLVPALILLVGSQSPRAVRRGALVLVITSLVVMAGAFPVQHPAPFGRLLTWVFDTFPAAAAFRTTNKAGSLLALGLALLGSTGLATMATASHATASRTLRQQLVRGAAIAGAVGVLAVAAFPLGSGGFYLGRYDVPSYWNQAARSLSTASDNQRVWLVPGERLANYRWATSSPDDLGRALLAPPSVVRTTVPNGSADAANLLAAADWALSDPDVPADVVAMYARMLGAGRILARNDLAYEKSGGLPPQLVASRLASSPGVHPEAAFGPPGLNTGPVSPGSTPLSPLELYTVEQPGALLQSRPASRSLLLVGDAYAVPSLAGAGLLGNAPLLSSLRSMSPDAAVAALRDGARVVLTDTNRRAGNDTSRLAGNEGPLMAKGAALPSTLATGTADQQTVLEVTGGSVSTSQDPSLTPVAQAAPENAFDGDPLTSWQFGGFAEAYRQSITRTFPAEQLLDEVVVHTVAPGARRIAKVRVTAGGAVREATVDPGGTARVNLAGVRASALRVSVTSVEGTGVGRVGISEVESSGGVLTRVAVLPKIAEQMTGPLSGAARQAVEAAPLDVLLTRANGGDGTADDEEASLNRDFAIIGGRNYFVAATVRPSPHATDSDFDAVAGYDGAVTAQGSSRAFDLPTLRGSQALDGRDDTAWIPSSPEGGQVLTITSAKARTVDHLTVRQEGGPGAPLENWVTRATVLVDGKAVVEGRLGPGETTLRFPEVEGSQFQLRIDAVARPTGTVRISEVVIKGLKMRKAKAGSACVAVLTVDGRPLEMRPASPLVDLSPRRWVTCRGAGLPLGDGSHSVRGTVPWSVDSLSLRDALGLDQPAPAAAAPLSDVHVGATRYSARIGGSGSSTAIVLGQGWSPGWRASLDGKALPPPVIVDGFSMGWVVQGSSRAHTVVIEYGPRTIGLAAMVVSLLAAVGALVIVWRGARGTAASWRRPVSPAGARSRLLSSNSGILRWGVLGLLPVLGGGVGGWTGLVLGAVLACVVGLGCGDGVLVIGASVVVGLVPIWWLSGNAGELGRVTPALVSGNLAPHHMALGALLLLIASLAAPERASGAPERAAGKVRS